MSLPSIVARPYCREGLAFVRKYRGQVSRPCAVCGEPVFRYEAEFRRRAGSVIACSLTCRGEAVRRKLVVQTHSGQATRIYAKGVDNPKWTGGVWQGLSYGPGWTKQRSAARERDGDTSGWHLVEGECRDRGRLLEVHPARVDRARPSPMVRLARVRRSQADRARGASGVSRLDHARSCRS